MSAKAALAAVTWAASTHQADRRAQLGQPGHRRAAGAGRARPQQLAGDVGEDRVVGSRPGGDVPGGEAGGLAYAGVDDPDLRSFPQIAQRGGRARHRRRVAVGDDRVHADMDEQPAAGIVRHRLQPGEAADQGSRHRLGRAVNGQRAEPGRGPDRVVQRLRHPVAGGVHTEPAAEEDANGGRAVAVQDVAQPGGEVVKAVLPGNRCQHPGIAGAWRRVLPQQRADEPPRVMVHGWQRAPLGTRVALGHWVVPVTAHPLDLVAVSVDEDPALRRADAAEAPHGSRHAILRYAE
jgi:hypothetical protein